MKKSKQILCMAVAAVGLFFTSNVMAQTNPRLGVGLNLGVPTSDFYDVAIGADLRYQFDLNKQLSIPVTAGYTHLAGKDNVPSFGYIPLKAGMKYFFNETGSGMYGLAEIGAGFGTKSGSGTSFVYSPAIGYSWSSGLDFGVKYEGLSRDGGNTGYVGLRLAYGFGL
ncbi:MAG: hypothetical protein EOO99_03205 [Pedobacter sp.]|nr:MAG: hypothetical protein EOO99_03205 [Pedobacter sp.]